MIAKKCDRCKKFYFPSDKTAKYEGSSIHDIGNKLAEGYEGIDIHDVVITLSYSITSYSGKSCITSLGRDAKEIDLCPKCAESFIEWFNKSQ